MSVSQVKKRFSEFETYLGRDKEALRRLKLLKDDVNVLRTSLAAAEEKAELAEAVKQAARERADAAEMRLIEVEKVAETSASVIAGLESKVRILTDQLHQTQDSSTASRVDPSDKEAAFKQMMRDLRKHMEFCPQSPRNGGKIPNDTMWFNRNEFADGFSHREIWKLGAAVAALVAFRGMIVLYTEETSREITKKGRIGSYVKPLLQWFKKNIRKDGVDETWNSLTEERKEKAEMDGRAQDTAYAMFGTEIEE
jgi:hypothetical protein